MSTEREEQLKQALRRVARRAFWWTLAHPFARAAKRRAHRDQTLAQFRQEMREAG